MNMEFFKRWHAQSYQEPDGVTLSESISIIQVSLLRLKNQTTVLNHHHSSKSYMNRNKHYCTLMLIPPPFLYTAVRQWLMRKSMLRLPHGPDSVIPNLKVAVESNSVNPTFLKQNLSDLFDCFIIKFHVKQVKTYNIKQPKQQQTTSNN